MGRPKKTTTVSTKSRHTTASKSPQKSQGNSRVSKMTAKKSPALKNKISTKAGSRPRSGSDDPQANNLQADVFHVGVNDDTVDIPFSQMLAEYCGPIDEESARIRMADALFLYQWNLVAHFKKEKFLNKGCPTASTASHTYSSPPPDSPELDGTAGTNLERANDNKIAVPPSSPAISLSSRESDEIRGAEEGTKVGQETAPSPANNGTKAVSASPNKLPRGHACTRCKTRKLKCDTSATCASCAQARASCVRPLQRASK